jgi:hypothetical protein
MQKQKASVILSALCGKWFAMEGREIKGREGELRSGKPRFT